MRSNRSVAGSFLFLANIVLLLPSPGAPQTPSTCEGPHTTKGEVQLFEGPPTFSTGQGWTLSPAKQVVLPKDTSVLICDRRWVGFVFGKKLWLYVKSDKGEGWISGENIVAELLKGTTKREGWATKDGNRAVFLKGSAALFWTSPAYAEVSAASAPPVPSRVSFYLLAFVALLTGMAVKGLFDHADQGILLKPYLRQTGKAFMVSPIVFLGLAQTGDIPLGGNAFLVFLCFAFQNGFFWQTILVRKTSPEPSVIAGRALTA